MSDDELEELFRGSPILYHMAERGSWPSIRRHGLLSTSALLDLFQVPDADRRKIEGERRPEGVPLFHPDLGQVVIRDQKPMDDAGLRRCLRDGLSPEDWYRILNDRVFFWLTRVRLVRLLTARPYRDKEHDVLELDTARLVAAHRRSISLSPINSGATKPFPRERGRDTFLPLEDYPYSHWRTRRARGERVVELAVMGGVPAVETCVRRVSVMRGDEVISTVFANN